MRVGVTGGAGFIGANLVRALVARDVDVVVVDDLSTGYRDNLSGLDIDLVEGSILADASLVPLLEVDAIVHLAALGSVPRSLDKPLASHAVNATGTLKVLEVARTARAHVVLASSSSVYGANPVLPKHEGLECMPMSPYAVSKLATEQYAMSYAHSFGLDVLPLRFFNVFGPFQRPGHAYAAVIPVFLDAAIRQRPLPVNGDGEQSRDFTYVGTVVDVLLRAVLERLTGAPTNLAFGTRVTLNELVSSIQVLMGCELDVAYRDERPGDVRHSQADHSRLDSLVPGLRPVPLEEGLASTFAWMRDGVVVPPPSTQAGER
jgi:UDP-glucose 4-epimerase